MGIEGSTLFYGLTIKIQINFKPSTETINEHFRNQ